MRVRVRVRVRVGVTSLLACVLTLMPVVGAVELRVDWVMVLLGDGMMG